MISLNHYIHSPEFASHITEYDIILTDLHDLDKHRQMTSSPIIDLRTHITTDSINDEIVADITAHFSHDAAVTSILCISGHLTRAHQQTLASLITPADTHRVSLVFVSIRNPLVHDTTGISRVASDTQTQTFPADRDQLIISLKNAVSIPTVHHIHISPFLVPATMFATHAPQSWHPHIHRGAPQIDTTDATVIIHPWTATPAIQSLLSQRSHTDARLHTDYSTDIPPQLIDRLATHQTIIWIGHRPSNYRSEIETILRDEHHITKLISHHIAPAQTAVSTLHSEYLRDECDLTTGSISHQLDDIMNHIAADTKKQTDRYGRLSQMDDEGGDMGEGIPVVVTAG